MAQVLKFLLLSMVILAPIASAEENRNITSLKNIKGNCEYQGLLIENGQSMKAEDFCERWTCRNGKLKIEGCPLPSKVGSCTYWNTGKSYYPSCCAYERVC
uniref:Single domain-containing protein n=1 Tax=Amblyomma cajennense TaxID=34607 RepID=A0A023FPP2_AMBCJ